MKTARSSFELVHGRSELIGRWVARVSQNKGAEERGWGECRAIGVMQDGKAVAGLVFHNWQPEADTIELSVASATPRWFSPPVLTAIEQQVEAFGVSKLVAWTPLKMTRWRRALLLAGGEDHPVPLLGKSLVVIEMSAWRGSRLARGRR